MSPIEESDLCYEFNRKAKAIDNGILSDTKKALTQMFNIMCVNCAEFGGVPVQTRIDALDARETGASFRYFLRGKYLRELLRSGFLEQDIPHPDSEFVTWKDENGVCGLVHIPIPFDEQRVIAHLQVSRQAAEAYRDQVWYNYLVSQNQTITDNLKYLEPHA